MMFAGSPGAMHSKSLFFEKNETCFFLEEEKEQRSRTAAQKCLALMTDQTFMENVRFLCDIFRHPSTLNPSTQGKNNTFEGLYSALSYLTSLSQVFHQDIKEGDMTKKL